MAQLQRDIDVCELQMKAADQIVADANEELMAKMDGSKKTVDKNEIVKASAKINVALGEKRRVEERLDMLKAKKKKN